MMSMGPDEALGSGAGLSERAPSDEELMLAFKAGNARAFEQLVGRHRGKVFNFILRQTGRRASAEELLQEVWLRVIRGAKVYQPNARFTTWLYTMARNLCVDAARKESHRKTESLEDSAPDAPALADRLAGEGPEPERAAHSLGVRPLLRKAISELPAEQREVFLLREYSGIPFKEIARVTGVPEPTVKSRMRYALSALQRALGELGVDGGTWDAGRTVA